MNNKRNRRNRPLLGLVLILILIAIPVWLTYRAVWQAPLNLALVRAVERNDAVAVRSLLQQGADPNCPLLPDDPRTGWQRFWDLLRNRPSPRPLVFNAPLLEATVWVPGNDIPEEAAAMISPYGSQHLIDNADVLQALIDAGAEVNIPTNDPWQKPPLELAAYLGKWKTMSLLLKSNADVNAADANGNTALMYAARQANAEIVEALLKRGAHVNARTDYGQTALFCALAPYHPERLEPVRMTVACLLRYGASIQGNDIQGRSVRSLMGACHDRQLIQILKNAGVRE